MKDFIIDANKYLEDGATPNPNYGATTVILYPDIEAAANKQIDLTTKQQILAQIAVLTTLANNLP